MTLFSISDMKAKDVMKTSFKTVDVNEPVSKALNAIDKDGIFSVLVFDNGNYAGYFGYKQLVNLHTGMSETTKIRGLISRGPAAHEDTPLIDIVAMMYLNDAKIIPLMADGKVRGVIETMDLLKHIPNIKETARLMVRDIMTPEPIFLRDDETIAQAAHLFKTQGIVRVPVVDARHRVQGILESHDFIKELRSKPEYGIDMFYGGGVGSVKAGALTRNSTTAAGEINIKGLMKSHFVTAFPDDSVSAKIPQLFEKEKTATIVVTDEENVLLGIVAPKDILHHLTGLRRANQFQIQSSGIEREESLTDFQRDKIAKAIEETVNRIHEVSDIQSFSIHLKTTRHTEGKQQIYHIFCKAVTDDGVFAARESEWDFVMAAGNALKEVESQIMHKVSKKKDVAKVRSLEGKRSTTA